MPVTGDWTLLITSPLGEQKADLAIADDLTGTISAMGETAALGGVTLAGNHLNFKASVTKPLPLALAFSLTLDGEKLVGRVQAGALGSWPVSGARG